MHTEKSIATILAETKDELKQFVTTRVNILKAEMDEKISRIKSVIPLAVVGALFLLSGWMVFTFALIALLHESISAQRLRMALGKPDCDRGLSAGGRHRWAGWLILKLRPPV